MHFLGWLVCKNLLGIERFYRPIIKWNKIKTRESRKADDHES